MALFAIGDLHLSFSVDKPMNIFGDVWKNHVNKIEKYWKRRVSDKDSVVITGDHSWGKNLLEAEKDLEFIISLPGKKIMLRGNHDMFWDVKKTAMLNEKYDGQFFFLQNNYAVYDEYALVGTKGYCFEGKDSVEHFEKIRDRELKRLQTSLECARNDGYQKYIMFLHYPPTSIGEMESGFTEMAERFGAEKVIYSHCHGKDRFQDSFLGMVNGIEYKLVSADFLKFKPEYIIK